MDETCGAVILKPKAPPPPILVPEIRSPEIDYGPPRVRPFLARLLKRVLRRPGA